MSGHRVGGWKAKRNGDEFEEYFRSLCRVRGITCVRVPNGCRVIGLGQFVQVKTPFDFILGKENKIVFCDLKSKEDDRIVFSAIKPHQVESLSQLGKHAHNAGYICYFKQVRKVVFISHDKLSKLRQGESLLWSDGVDLGSIQDMNLDLLFL